MSMKPEGPSCQSCGMPMSRDAKGGGTNADGSRNADYCSHCYDHGAYTAPGMTAAEMTARVREKLSAMNLPAPVVDRLTAAIPTLERWRT